MNHFAHTGRNGSQERGARLSRKRQRAQRGIIHRRECRGKGTGISGFYGKGGLQFVVRSQSIL